MSLTKKTVIAGLALTLVGLTPTVATAEQRGVGQPRSDLGRQVLAANDGWASAEGGTTGGAAAPAENVYHVSTWPEFQAALGGPGNAGRTNTEARIIYVHGELNAYETADGTLATCSTFEDATGFSQAAYIEAFDPAGPWGWTDPAGELVTLQAAAANAQALQTQQHIGSNKTIIGVGDDARIVGANLRIRDADNVIVRNLTVSDSTDCFPEWDPGDGQTGNWNSRYDNISVWTSTHVWVDHTTLDSGTMPPDALGTVYGRPYEVHDGLLDITHSSDLVTVSYNRFEAHDKTMLIGSSDSRTADRGTLRVTIHHNRWTDIGQRAPRVRYGQVDVYNNHYVQTTGQDWYAYFWGLGRESQLYAENNYIELAPGTDAASVVRVFGGTAMTEIGTRVNRRRVSVVDAYNAANPSAPIGSDAGWTPQYRLRVDPTMAVPRRVEREAGAGVLG
ncbi:hypothetical protein PCC79_00410 [Propioniciclava soli]|uniref:Pectate lyase domain-containing protein n=1 Tax=Propioniciclava soli TaxID=2775081 RepID=A0ABZ3CAB4_9ACTN